MDNRGYKKTSLYCKGENPEESRAFSIFKRLGRRKIDFLVSCVNLVEESYNVDLADMSSTKILGLFNDDSSAKGTVKKKTPNTVVLSTKEKPVKADIAKEDTPMQTESNAEIVDEESASDEILDDQAQLLLDGLDIM